MSRRTGETGGVLSFTFLDVLTCTMGSLVLLVVVLGQRAKDVRLDEALKHQGTGQITESAPKPPEPSNAQGLTADEAKKKLAELKAQKSELDRLRAEAASRTNDEQARVSHLEEHERRLEHELAKLQITLDRLEEAEKKQHVDQDAAERNLKRLNELLGEREKELDALRKDGGGKKSYAIVPYKGANGTFRQPIYIECTKEAVTIQPEGIQLKAIDFDGPIRSGNPLAAAMRAAREELNARARAAGKTDLPDPYPLLIVRPNGANAYAAAVSAIAAWDADYGYEFVASDWNLEFPDPDPKLNQVMQHAVDQARDRQAMLAKVAPRRYGSRLSAAGQGGAGGGGYGEGGYGEGDGFDVLTEGGAGDRIGENSQAGFVDAGGGNGRGGGKTSRGSSTGGHDEDFANSVAESAHYGEIQGNGSGGSGNGGPQPPLGAPQRGAGDSASEGATALAGGQQGMSGGSAQGATSGEKNLAAALDGGQGQPGGAAGDGSSAGGAGSGHGQNGSAGNSSASGGGGSAMAGVAPAGARGSTGGGSPSIQLGSSSTQGVRSAAEKRGANWANAEASHRSSPITRPIQVVIRPDEVSVLSDDGSVGQKVQSISFHQPTDRVLDELAAAVQQHIKDWGLAGQGMYWRPTLVLQVAPGADRHAIRLNDLLRDSGVDVRFKDVASKPEEASRATR